MHHVQFCVCKMCAQLLNVNAGSERKCNLIATIILKLKQYTKQAKISNRHAASYRFQFAHYQNSPKSKNKNTKLFIVLVTMTTHHLCLMCNMLCAQLVKPVFTHISSSQLNNIYSLLFYLSIIFPMHNEFRSVMFKVRTEEKKSDIYGKWWRF